ncbi:hypothetical protein BaRGS_00027518, partial [Batillaria attramentaria]
ARLERPPDAHAAWRERVGQPWGRTWSSSNTAMRKRRYREHIRLTNPEKYLQEKQKTRERMRRLRNCQRLQRRQ